MNQELHLGSRKESIRWFTGIALLSMVLLGIYVLVATPGRHFAAASIAWITLTIGIGMMTLLLKSKSLGALLPFMYLAKTSAAWGLAPAYLMGYAPDGVFITRKNTYIPIFENSSETMGIVIVFMLVYCGALLPFAWRAKPTSPSGQLLTVPPRTASWCVMLVTGILAVHALSKAFPFPDALSYLVVGTHKYLVGIAAIAGASFHLVPKPVKLICLAIFAGATGIYTLGNSRGFVAVPVILFFLGFLTRPDVRSGIKTIAVFSLAGAGAFFFLFANTTRLILGTGGYEDLGKRVAALSRWREVFSDFSVLGNVLGRINYGAGWVVIGQTPDSVSYVTLNILRFIYAWGYKIVIPGKAGFAGEGYVGNDFLHAYGYRVREGVGVEPSMIAACWVLGGWMPLIAGAALLAVLHGLIIIVISMIAKKDRMMAAFMTGAALTAFLDGPTWGLIDHSRLAILFLVGAAIVYRVGIRPLIPIRERIEGQYDALPGRR